MAVKMYLKNWKCEKHSRKSSQPILSVLGSLKRENKINLLWGQDIFWPLSYSVIEQNFSSIFNILHSRLTGMAPAQQANTLQHLLYQLVRLWLQKTWTLIPHIWSQYTPNHCKPPRPHSQATKPAARGVQVAAPRSPTWPRRRVQSHPRGPGCKAGLTTHHRPGSQDRRPAPPPRRSGRPVLPPEPLPLMPRWGGLPACPTAQGGCQRRQTTGGVGSRRAEERKREGKRPAPSQAAWQGLDGERRGWSGGCPHPFTT